MHIRRLWLTPIALGLILGGLAMAVMVAQADDDDALFTEIRPGFNNLVYLGSPLPVVDALGPALLPATMAIFRWDPALGQFQYWLPDTLGIESTLRELRTNDVFWLRASRSITWRQEVIANVMGIEDLKIAGEPGEGSVLAIVNGELTWTEPETTLVGSAGIPGPSGPAGAPGPVGATGPAGADGRGGTDGNDGTVGPPGRAGTPGADGAPGRDGAPGVDGGDGPPGADGARGAPGADGRDGPRGADGLPGMDGVPGADGTDGIDGAVGPTGPAGPQGNPGAGGQLAFLAADVQIPFETEILGFDADPGATAFKVVYFNSAGNGNCKAKLDAESPLVIQRISSGNIRAPIIVEGVVQNSGATAKRVSLVADARPGCAGAGSYIDYFPLG